MSAATATLARPTCRRHQASPSRGVCRWLPAAPNGNARLRITTAAGVSHDYEVEAIRGGYNLYRMTEDGEVAAYHLDATVRPGMLACNCRDAMQRGSFACKHSRGVRASLEAAPF